MTRYVALAIAAAGAAIAGYLVIAGPDPACVIAHGCSVVQSSSYAKLSGIPVAALGLVAYGVIAAALWPRHGRSPHGRRGHRAHRYRVLRLAHLRRGLPPRGHLRLVRRVGRLHDRTWRVVHRPPHRGNPSAVHHGRRGMYIGMGTLLLIVILVILLT